MPQILLCPHGHEWELKENGCSGVDSAHLVCPVCGTAVAGNDLTVVGSKRGFDEATVSDGSSPAPNDASLNKTLYEKEGTDSADGTILTDVSLAKASAGRAPSRHSTLDSQKVT